MIEGETSLDQCAKEGCEVYLPAGHHHRRLYCDEHQPEQSKPKRDRAPKLVVEIGNGAKTTKKDSDAARVAGGATALMTMLAQGVMLAGDDVCGTAMAMGAKNWGAAMGELAKYQPALVKIFAPTQSDQVVVWISAAIATSAIVIPVLTHHGLMPEAVASKLAGTMVAATQMADASDPA